MSNKMNIKLKTIKIVEENLEIQVILGLALKFQTNTKSMTNEIKNKRQDNVY